MDSPPIPPRGSSLASGQIGTSPAEGRDRPSASPRIAPRTFRGRSVAMLSQSARLLPGTVEMKRSTSTPSVAFAERNIRPQQSEQRLVRTQSQPVMYDQPRTAGEAISNARSGLLEAEGGEARFFSSLLKSDMPYSELRQLAWSPNMTSRLSSSSLHTVRQAWAVRKSSEFIGKNATQSLDQTKQQLSAELTSKKVPQRYVLEAMVALDTLKPGPQRLVSPHGQQLFYMMHARSPEKLTDTKAMLAFAKALDQQMAAGRIDKDAVLAMASDIHGAPNLDEMPVNISLLMKLNQLDKATAAGEEMPVSPTMQRPVPAPRRKKSAPSSPTPVPRTRTKAQPQPQPRVQTKADQMAGVGSQLKLNHTPSLNQTERVHLEQTYGVKTVPIKLQGKEIAYIFTTAPDGKPKDRVLLSCHASGRNNRPKFEKNLATTMLFAGTRDNVLNSRTVKFAEGLAAGKARFHDDSQIYAKIQREVTDYSISGGIGTKPEMAAQQLAGFREEGVVNDFDYLLLDRNAKGLHLSDLMQALQESGITHKQIINHLCRPQTSAAGNFQVLQTFDESEALNLSSVDPDLDFPDTLPKG